MEGDYCDSSYELIFLDQKPDKLDLIICCASHLFSKISNQLTDAALIQCDVFITLPLV